MPSVKTDRAWLNVIELSNDLRERVTEQADLWPGNLGHEERQAAEIERLATTGGRARGSARLCQPRLADPAMLVDRGRPVRLWFCTRRLQTWKAPARPPGPERRQERGTDPAVIRSWWRRKPKANLAVRTGRQSGLTVVDIDGEEGERALVALERRFGALPDLYPMQWTGAGRGGWQAFVAWPEGREIRNSASRLEPKLDTRGEGGYVLVPPSAAAEPYRWAPDRDPWTLQPEPAPGWLLDLLDPPSAPEPRQPWSGQPRTAGADGDRYLERAIAAELALIASAPEGRRNDQFNESAFSLFRFAAEGRIAAGSVARGLEAAARHAGLAPREIASTLKSAATKRGVQL